MQKIYVIMKNGEFKNKTYVSENSLSILLKETIKKFYSNYYNKSSEYSVTYQFDDCMKNTNIYELIEYVNEDTIYVRQIANATLLEDFTNFEKYQNIEDVKERKRKKKLKYRQKHQKSYKQYKEPQVLKNINNDILEEYPHIKNVKKSEIKYYSIGYATKVRKDTKSWKSTRKHQYKYEH